MLVLQYIVLLLSRVILATAVTHQDVHHNDITHTSEEGQPSLHWLNTFVDVNDDATIGVIYLQFISQVEMKTLWLADDSNGNLRPVSIIPGIREHTQTDHVSTNYYITSMSLKWQRDLPPPDNYNLQYMISAKDASFGYSRIIWVSELLNSRKNPFHEDPLKIPSMDILQRFPTTTRFAADGNNNISVVLSVHADSINPENFYHGIRCRRSRPGGRELDLVYQYNSVTPSFEEEGGSVVVVIRESDAGGVVLSLRLSLMPKNANDEITYFCTLDINGIYIDSSVDVLLESSYSFFPQGYDQAPKIEVFESNPRIPHYLIQCERFTTIPGVHSLSMMHNGQPVKIIPGDRYQYQRETLYREMIKYELVEPSEEQMGEYTCITETGRQASAHVPAEEEEETW